MTFKYNNVYINCTSTVTGPYEGNGPLGNYFDKSFSDLYFGEKNWEDAESKLIKEALEILYEKTGETKFDIDLFISGDLSNQLAASNYAYAGEEAPLIGIYAACASSTLGLALAANNLERKEIEKVVCTVCSHNNAAEKQFRYPVEYGGPKPKTTTFTATGGVAALVSGKKEGIRLESATIGKVINSNISDVYHMGAVMAPAAADTIYRHLQDTGRSVNYYDLILTGDLGIYGKEILKEYMEKEYGITLQNYEDTGVMLFNLQKQPVYAGASGPVCAPLVTYGYIFSEMKKKKLKRVLLVATGALMNPSRVNEKESIPAIAHAVSLEVLA